MPTNYKAAPEAPQPPMVNLVGHTVHVQLTSGKYEGILHTGWWEGVTGVCLKQAKLLVGPNDKAQPRVPEKTILARTLCR